MPSFSRTLSLSLEIPASLVPEFERVKSAHGLDDKATVAAIIEAYLRLTAAYFLPTSNSIEYSQTNAMATQDSMSKRVAQLADVAEKILLYAQGLHGGICAEFLPASAPPR